MGLGFSTAGEVIFGSGAAEERRYRMTLGLALSNGCYPAAFICGEYSLRQTNCPDIAVRQEINLLSKIDHVAIAVRSLDAALEVYAHVLGLLPRSVEEVPEQKVRVAMLAIGESRIELLEATAADSPVAGFLAKRGEGVHHICFQVENLDDELQKLTSAGLRLIDQTARTGAGGCRIAFLHPSGTAGVLIELSQPGDKTPTHSNSE